MRIWYNLLLFLFMVQIEEKKPPNFLNNDVFAIFISDSRHHTLFSKRWRGNCPKKGGNPKEDKLSRRKINWPLLVGNTCKFKFRKKM